MSIVDEFGREARRQPSLLAPPDIIQLGHSYERPAESAASTPRDDRSSWFLVPFIALLLLALYAAWVDGRRYEREHANPQHIVKES